MAVIALYNKKLDDIMVIIHKCTMDVHDFEGLKIFIDKGDTLLLASPFSLYGIDMTDMIKLVEELELKIEIVDENNKEITKPVHKISLITYLAYMNFIETDKEMIKKVLESEEEN